MTQVGKSQAALTVRGHHIPGGEHIIGDRLAGKRIGGDVSMPQKGNAYIKAMLQQLLREHGENVARTALSEMVRDYSTSNILTLADDMPPQEAMLLLDEIERRNRLRVK